MADLNSTVQYLDYAGLSRYDSLIKTVISNGDAAVMKALNDAIGEGGSVADLIEEAINALKGTINEGDPDTLAGINGSVSALEDLIDTLKADDTTAGSIAKAIKDAVEALDSDGIENPDNKAVVNVKTVDGIATPVLGNISAKTVTFTANKDDDDNPISASANTNEALNELFTKVSNNVTSGKVTVEKDGSVVDAIAADGKTYTLKQGTTTVATINIAKDMVVSEGIVITADGTELKGSSDSAESAGLTADNKYIRMTIANGDEKSNYIYIPVNELYKDHTVELNASKIQLAINTNNVISASVVEGSIAEGDLTTALQAKINSAATKVNEKSTGHVTVSVTAAEGSNPAEVTIGENDIASATDLSNEITRAKNSESEIATLVGITGAEESRAYSTNVTLDNGVTKNVVADINKLNSRLSSVETFLGNMTNISNDLIDSLFSVSNEESGNTEEPESGE